MSACKLTIFILIFHFSFGDNKIVINKCCPFDQYVGFKKHCKNDTGVYNFTNYNFGDVVVYNKDIAETKKKVFEVFTLVPAKSRNFSMIRAFDMSRKFNNYLLEDGTVMQELPNSFNRFKPIANDKFCIDIALPNGRNIHEPQFRIWTIPTPVPEDEFESNSIFLVSGFLVSSVFLILVLIVYCLLPELRNLCGKILMAYVACLLATFLSFALLDFISMADENTEIICLIFTFLIHYFCLACFCWMNVMSIDIWWTFRGYAKARPIHRRGETFKFLMYSLYAFGMPLVLTIGMGVIDRMDLRHIPWFIKPDINGTGCFLEGSGKFMYLYVPMLVIIVMNWILFLMTSFNIWRLSRGTAVLDSPAAGNPSAHRTHRHRFMLYLKLSVIMGVSWVLEVLSALSPEYRAWYLSDAYNLLMGFFIFLIFVCKKKIIKKLEKRYVIVCPKLMHLKHACT
ncbi:G-protein coupled receptor Mth2-like [Cydia fagiglandana]|uniref:G-protein coupled receptor Mth2-like n=1 Tax=Cydia fagiglandana TaxID=1458189 RepID=UPI002FEE4189